MRARARGGTLTACLLCTATATLGAAGLGHGIGSAVTRLHDATVASASTVGTAGASGAPSRAGGGPDPDADLREATARRYVSTWRVDLGRTPPHLLDAWLARPELWRDELVPILESYRVPADFLYLALLESGMDPDAESPSRAVGLWQFTESTARQYGLRVGDGVDQRRDSRLSTFAAGRYLRDLYDHFGSWELAAAAYNGGPGRVSRALELSGSDSYWDLVEAGHLPAETRAYVPKFLAVVELAQERVGP